ncbi:MAG: glycosyltransferase family 9 protein [Prochloraceae cyanobacterium]
MEIFSNQTLRSRPHIAIFSSTKIGNFVITTPLLRGLKEKYPDCILDFFGSEITKDFEKNCPYIDWRFSLYNSSLDFLENLTHAVKQRRQIAGDYDLAINCDQFSEINLVTITALRPKYVVGAVLSPDFRLKIDPNNHPVQKILNEKDWNSQEFLQRNKNILKSNYIAEIFCRIAYVETDYFKLELPQSSPNFTVPDILISTTATRPAKMWPANYWKQVITWCRTQNLTVGLLGNTPKIQQQLYYADNIETDILNDTDAIDLRGKTSLTQLAGALAKAKACLTIDTGTLHIAAAVGCPTVAIFGNNINGSGASPIRLWSPRTPEITIAFSQYNCTICEDNHFKNKSCAIENHPCMKYLTPQTAIDLLQLALQPSPATVL